MEHPKKREQVRQGPRLGDLAAGSKGDRTRKRLIGATVALLGRVRLKDLRVAEISRRAEVSPAAFYVYFKDVTDVVLAAIHEVPAVSPTVLALLAQPWRMEDAFDLASSLVANYLDYWDMHRTLFRVRNLAAEEGDQRFLSIRQEAVQPMLDAIVEQVRRKGGDSETNIQNAKAMAGVLMAMLERIGAVLPVYFGTSERDVSDLAEVNRTSILLATAKVFATMLT